MWYKTTGQPSPVPVSDVQTHRRKTDVPQDPLPSPDQPKEPVDDHLPRPSAPAKPAESPVQLEAPGHPTPKFGGPQLSAFFFHVSSTPARPRARGPARRFVPKRPAYKSDSDDTAVPPMFDFKDVHPVRPPPLAVDPEMTLIAQLAFLQYGLDSGKERRREDQRTIERLSRELGEKRAALEGAEAELERVTAELEEMADERDMAESERDDAWGERDHAQVLLDCAQCASELKESNLAGVQRELAGVRAELGQAKIELDDARDGRARAQTLLDTAQYVSELKENRLAEVRRELAGVYAELDQAKSEVDKAEREMERARSEMDGVKSGMDRAKDEMDRVKGEMDAARTEADASRAALVEAQAELGQLEHKIRVGAVVHDTLAESLEETQCENSRLRSECGALMEEQVGLREEKEAYALELRLRAEENEGLAQAKDEATTRLDEERTAHEDALTTLRDENTELNKNLSSCTKERDEARRLQDEDEHALVAIGKVLRRWPGCEALMDADVRAFKRMLGAAQVRFLLVAAFWQCVTLGAIAMLVQMIVVPAKTGVQCACA